MTTLSRNDFKNKVEPLGSGLIGQADKITPELRMLVDKQLANGFTAPAHVNLARDVIRNRVAYNGETLDNVVPSRNLQKACEKASANAMSIALNRQQRTER